jgi:hypothetical protein
LNVSESSFRLQQDDFKFALFAQLRLLAGTQIGIVHDQLFGKLRGMRSEAIYWRVVPFLLSGLVLPGFLQAYHDSTIACGTLVGQTMAAAGWLALGPMAFHWRLPLAVIWPVLLYLAEEEFIHQGEFVGSYDLAIFLTVLWLLSFGLFWSVLRVRGWRLQESESQEPSSQRPAWQFRVIELLAITGVVAVVLAVGRIVVPEFLRSTGMPTTWRYWAPLLATSVPLGVTLLLGALDKRSHWLTIGGSLVVAAVGVFVVDHVRERCLPLWMTINPDVGPTITVGLVWITLFGVAIRSSGFRLHRGSQ